MIDITCQQGISFTSAIEKCLKSPNLNYFVLKAEILICGGQTRLPVPVTFPKDYSLRVDQYRDNSDCVLLLVYPLQAVGVYLGCIKMKALKVMSLQVILLLFF